MLKGSLVKYLIIAIIILTAIYIGGLYHFNNPLDMLTGFIFLLMGEIIPSIFNLLVSCSIVMVLSHFIPQIPRSCKIILLVIVSFLLGVNVHINEIFHTGKVVEVKVINPLHLTKSFTISSIVNPSMTANLENVAFLRPQFIIKPSPFTEYRIRSSEGCMCIYFQAPESIFHRAERTLNAFGNKGSYIQVSSDPDYKFTFNVKPQGNNVYLETIVTDKADGKIVINSIYPKSYILDDVFIGMKDSDMLDSKAAWKYRFYFLLNNNFWQWILEKLTSSDPIEALHNQKVPIFKE